MTATLSKASLQKLCDSLEQATHAITLCLPEIRAALAAASSVEASDEETCSESELEVGLSKKGQPGSINGSEPETEEETQEHASPEKQRRPKRGRAVNDSEGETQDASAFAPGSKMPSVSRVSAVLPAAEAAVTAVANAVAGGGAPEA